MQHRIAKDTEKEKQMNEKIKKQVKIDKETWMNNLLEDGNWNAVRRFKKQCKHTHAITQLRDGDGHILPV